MAYFRNRSRKGSQRRKTLTTELKYFRQRREQMRYAEFRLLNLPIGTGVNEAACKTLVPQGPGETAGMALRRLPADEQWHRTSSIAPGKVGDRGRSGVDNRGFVEAVIPCQKSRKVQRDHDTERYQNRNRVERFFCRLKHCRRIDTHFVGTRV